MLRRPLDWFLSGVNLVEDGLSSRHPLTGRHEDLRDKLATDLNLTNPELSLGDDWLWLSNGIRRCIDQYHVGQVLSEDFLRLFISDVSDVRRCNRRVSKLLELRIERIR